MTEAKDTPGNERRADCVALARQRAARARRKGVHPVLVWLLVVCSLISGPYALRRSAALPVHSSTPARGGSREVAEWPVTEYERGPVEPLRGRRDAGRYRSRPSLTRLIRDLRRPAARHDATMALAARISDVDLRAWVLEKVVLGDITRLALHVRPQRSEDTIFEAWQRDREVEAKEEVRIGDVWPKSDRDSLLAVARLLEVLAREGEATSTRLTPK